MRSTFDLWHQQSFGSTRFTAMQRGFIPSYSTTIADADSKKRYADKLDTSNGIDPYEIPRNEWQDNIDMWPAITHVHVCMYLILSPSPYTKEDLLNYKSLDCYQNFVRGWVREVFVKAVNNKRIVIGKVIADCSILC